MISFSCTIKFPSALSKSSFDTGSDGCVRYFPCGYVRKEEASDDFVSSDDLVAMEEDALDSFSEVLKCD